jgi:hypothetical protein
MNYNGWTNYETWAAKLWIDNEEVSYRYWKAQAEECAKTDAPAWDLAIRLRDETREKAPKSHLMPGLYGDLLMTALDRVNWNEIAESMIEDAKEITEPSQADTARLGGDPTP